MLSWHTIVNLSCNHDTSNNYILQIIVLVYHFTICTVNSPLPYPRLLLPTPNSGPSLWYTCSKTVWSLASGVTWTVKEPISWPYEFCQTCVCVIESMAGSRSCSCWKGLWVEAYFSKCELRENGLPLAGKLPNLKLWFQELFVVIFYPGLLQVVLQYRTLKVIHISKQLYPTILCAHW